MSLQRPGTEMGEGDVALTGCENTRASRWSLLDCGCGKWHPQSCRSSGAPPRCVYVRRGVFKPQRTSALGNREW